MNCEQLLTMIIEFYSLQRLVQKYGVHATAEQIQETQKEIENEILQIINK